MYNRYVPQNDGTYRRSRMSEPGPPRQETPRYEPPQEQREPEATQAWDHRETPLPPRPKANPTDLGSFFRQLIPAGFDTEDLMVVLLLLLMAGETREDRDYALLTLFLYLFL